jgi:MoaA/NifB/PqqE/SkfB family radical SAM enzyme
MLEDIGFYTLSDKRAEETSWKSDLQRCELILTDRCNFNCVYCRGIKKDLRGDLTLGQAKRIINIWAQGNIHNVRFSGGEPTMWEDLDLLVRYTRSFPSIQHIAISTNGSASLKTYLELHRLGVNDFSISLDSCCAMTADLMAGKNINFEHICNVIRELSKITYVTVGVVLDTQNSIEVLKIIEYATDLGVSDIRIIPSAQYNQIEYVNFKTKYPILNYRLNNLKSGGKIRGMQESDCNKCHLVKDDMAVLSGQHFPCIIYMREQGSPCGNVYGNTLEEIREQRKYWFEKTNTYENEICRKNCLDVCIEYNNKVEEYGSKTSINL